jgi:Phosphotransferase enzyme family
MSIDLRRVAAAALQQKVLSAAITSRAAIAYDPYLAGRHVESVHGSAEVALGPDRAWSAIVKRTNGVGLRAARRELAAYRLGIAAERGLGALRAPALLAFDEGEEHVELWLEALTDVHGGRWPVHRFGTAARHIAGWAVRTSASGPESAVAAEDGWAERQGQPARLAEALESLCEVRHLPAAEELMASLADPAFERTEAMIVSTPSRIAQLAADHPQILLHHDLVRSNLFALTDSSTAAIDWETVGSGPAGVELAPLVVGSVRRGEASAADLLAIEDVVLSGYESVLAEGGRPIGGVRSAYRLALGLRWHVVLGTIRAWFDPTLSRMRGSRPSEPRAKSLTHLVPLARHLLDAADYGVRASPRAAPRQAGPPPSA